MRQEYDWLKIGWKEWKERVCLNFRFSPCVLKKLLLFYCLYMCSSTSECWPPESVQGVGSLHERGCLEEERIRGVSAGPTWWDNTEKKGLGWCAKSAGARKWPTRWFFVFCTMIHDLYCASLKHLVKKVVSKYINFFVGVLINGGMSL